MSVAARALERAGNRAILTFQDYIRSACFSVTVEHHACRDRADPSPARRTCASSGIVIAAPDRRVGSRDDARDRRDEPFEPERKRHWVVVDALRSDRP